jgi:hypothetical protein
LPPEERRQIADVVELVEAVELTDVFMFEERGRRIDVTGTSDDEPIVYSFASIGDREDDDEGEYGIGFRFRIVFDDRLGNEFVSDFQARYMLQGPTDVPKAVRAEFAERVAFFAVYPYLRASIQMTASRMAAPAPVLEMVRAGEFSLGDSMSPEDVEEQFRDLAPEGRT